MMHKLSLTILVAAVAVAGCQDESTAPKVVSAPEPVIRADHIDLVAMPTALNWDDRPGPDGVQAQVFLYQLQQPMPVTVSGALDFFLFEGSPTVTQMQQAEPFMTWTFQAFDLPGHSMRSMGLWGYAFRLPWGQRTPTAANMTLIARYRPPQGQAVWSSPVSVTVRAQ